MSNQPAKTLDDLLDDVLEKNGIEVDRQFSEVQEVRLERHSLRLLLPASHRPSPFNRAQSLAKEFRLSCFSSTI